MSIKDVLHEDTGRSLIRMCLLLTLCVLAAFAVVAGVSARQMEAGLAARESAVAGRLIALHPAEAETITDAFTAKTLSAREQALGAQAFAQHGYDAETTVVLAPFFRSVSGQAAWLYGVIAALAVAVLGVYALARMSALCGGVARLAAQATEIARGDLDIRFDQSAEGVLGRMQGALHEVAAGVRTRFEKLDQNRAFLKDLISDISHQLKTPLAALKMYQEILAQEPMGEDARAFVTRSGEQIERMEWLVLGLLKMARVEAGQLALHLRPQNPDALCRRVAADFAQMAEEKGVGLVVAAHSRTALDCDAAWLREAVGNVVKNCIESTPAGGQVFLETQETPVAHILTVRDTGPGIPPDDLPFIFRRFYRGSGRTGGGSGIGLPLARSITEQMGGTLGAGGIYGQGAVFTFTFLRQTM